MKIAVTVNLGNYENIRIESSEDIDEEQCREELIHALMRFEKEPRVIDSVNRVFK